MERDKVVRALQKVRDPLTGNDIISAGLVETLEISEGNAVHITLMIASPNLPHKSELNFSCIGAIQDEYPFAEVHVHLKTKATDTDKPESPLPNLKNIIAVGSGKGGVGKSTVSLNLALALKQMGYQVGLLDADIYGPSLPTMTNMRSERPSIQDVYGSPKIVPLMAFNMPVISMGFLIEPEQAVVLRGPRLAGILKQFFMDTLWPELDYLIVDLPPGTGDIQLTLVQTVPVTGAIIVTTPQDVAIADALKAANMFKLDQVKVPVIGIVENMSWFTPEELPDNKYYIFGQGGGKQLAQQSNTVLLGQIPLVQSIREGSDNGQPAILQGGVIASHFMTIAENMVRQMAYRNETIAPTERVLINPQL